MSDLHWALVGLSVVAIVGVWFYNLWQERKFRKATDDLFKATGADASVGPDTGARTDAPVFNDAAGNYSRVEPQVAAHGVDRSADSSVDATAGVVDGASAETFNQYAPWADPAADCVVRFDVASGVAAPAIWAAQSTWSTQLSKPLRYLARQKYDDPWQLVLANDSGSYSQWLAALQLADRQGAVTDRELLVLFDGLTQLVTQLDTVVDLPSRTETLLRARQLDDFCAGVDVQFSLHVVDAQGGSFAGKKLRGVCEAAGLVLQADGSFHAADVNGATEYVVKNSGAEMFTLDNLRSLVTSGLTLTLDVPRVADGIGAFDRMVGTARQLERGLGGKLVDAQRAALADELILGVRTKIGELQNVMQGADMRPGGPLAAKLFSG